MRGVGKCSSKKNIARKRRGRSLALILATILMMSLIACGKEENQPAYTIGGNVAGESGSASDAEESANGGQSEASAGSTQAGSVNTTVTDVILKEAPEDGMVYVAQPFEVIAGDFNAFYNMRVKDDVLCYGSQHTVVCHPLSGGMEMKTMYWEGQEEEWRLNQIAFDGEDNVYGIVTITARPTSKSFLCKFDGEGQLVYSVPLNDKLAEVDESAWSSAWDIEADKNGNVYFKGKTFLWLYDSEGNFAGDVKFGSSPSYEPAALAKAKNGRVYISYIVTGNYNNTYIGEVDFAAKCTVNVNKASRLNGFGTGFDGEMFIRTATTAYSYNHKRAEMEPLFNWLDSNINGNNLVYAESITSKQILAVTYDHSAGGEVYLVEKMSREQAEEQGLLEERTIITLASWGNFNTQDLQAAITSFNKYNENYKVVVVDYLDGVVDGETAVNRLSSELAAGKGPDLIAEDFGLLPALAGKGGIENLYEYLEKSEELSKEDFFENILEEYTVDGVLTAIPYDVMIRTWVGSADIVGEEMGWTLEEMLALAEQHENTQLVVETFGPTRRSVIMTLLQFYGEDFLDWEMGTCEFDNDLFKKILEFAADYPAAYESPAKDAPSIYTKLEMGEALLTEVSLWNFREIQPYQEALKENMTVIGYPCKEGVGCDAQTMCAYGISSKSDNKEGAWEFLEYFLQFDNTGGIQSMSGFTSNKRLLEKLLKKDQMNDNSSMMHASDGWKYKFHPTTQEEADLIYELIGNMNFSSTSLTVIDIIMEETESYYSGQKPLDVVIGIIENRVTNYMAENR